MSCAPFRVERSHQRRPLFPVLAACHALRGHETHPECCCRAYPNRGLYVIGTCGHAHGWNLQRPAADAQAARLTAMSIATAQACRECGCTESRACGPDKGGPCAWVPDPVTELPTDLCTSCADEVVDPAPTTRSSS